MLTVPVAMGTALGGSINTAFFADLVTVVLLDGTTTFRWTSAPYDVVDSGNTFRAAGANGPMVRDSSINNGEGLSVDTLDVTLIAAGYTIGGLSLQQLAVAGYFDGARIKIDLLVMPAPGDFSLGSVQSWFEGRISTAEPEGPRTILRCKSELETLTQTLPRFRVQPACGNSVYDTNCAILEATFTLSGTVSAVTSASQFATGSGALTAKAVGYFNLGVLTFTSGALAGQSQDVLSWRVAGSNTFLMELPFTAAPQVGDAFSVFPGCNRTRAMCGDATKFNNLVHFRGYPHLPAVEAGS